MLQDLERQALMQYLRSASSNTDVQATRDGERAGNARSNSVLQRTDEDVMVNLKLLQRENPRPLPKPRSSNLQDNRVYRKQVLKKPVQLQSETQNLRLPQQVLRQSDQVQRAQQLLQEHRALLQITQASFDQQKLQKLPQQEFLTHQQNFQQPQPLSQLHLIELQQRLSHPGLSPQQVAELQTLYHHQTLVSPELEFLLQKSKKMSSKTVPIQKQTLWRPQKIEEQTLQQRGTLISDPAPQPQMMEVNRWMSALSCPPSPTHQVEPALGKKTLKRRASELVISVRDSQFSHFDPGEADSSSQLQQAQARQLDENPAVQADSLEVLKVPLLVGQVEL